MISENIRRESVTSQIKNTISDIFQIQANVVQANNLIKSGYLARIVSAGNSTIKVGANFSLEVSV